MKYCKLIPAFSLWYPFYNRLLVEQLVFLRAIFSKQKLAIFLKMIFLLYFIILKVKGKKWFGIVRHFDPGELGTRGQGHFGQEDARDITTGK